MKHREEIEKAYTKITGDENFTISMSHKLTPESSRKIKVETAISFVIDRVKDSRNYNLNEAQPGLFDKNKPGEKPNLKGLPGGKKGKKGEKIQPHRIEER
jgi:hypothetical protein